jgi:iron complex outermembrane receptor protein
MSSRFYWRATASILAISAPTFAAAQEDVARDEIVVTASPLARSAQETIAGTSVVSGDELERSLENSIGETLRREPGVSSTFFGPGASRPVIRGLGGDRISVLESGIGSIDASSTSPDHAVSVEPATAERIEIVRGVSTLLYGSSAAGGVVNVFSGRIPRSLPEGVVDGAIRIGGSTVDEGVEAAGGFDIDLGKAGGGNFVFHGDGAYRETDDYEIPGFAESARLRAMEAGAGGAAEDEAFGVVENTSLKTRGGSAGLSYVMDNGFIGFSGTALNTNYGVPGAHGHDGAGGGEDEGGVTIGLKQRRIDFDSEIDAGFLLFQKTRLRVGYADYTHSEIEPSGEIGTVFANKGVEGRFELVDRTSRLGGGELNGASGVHWKLRDFSAIGEEAFVPPTKSRQLGFFTIKEYGVGLWRFEVGGRYENTRHRASDFSAERKFDAFSVSAGIGFEPADEVFFGVTGLRTERAPSTEELFSNGPHLATGVFEIGDPTLGKETARGVEATFRFGDGDAWSFGVNGFYTSYRDFIFENATGLDADVDGELIPIYAFEATDAAFKGFEAELDAELFRLGPFHIHGHAAADYVRATADASATGNLPRIPPFTGLFALEAKSERLEARGEIDHALAQRKVGFDELPTDRYTIYNLYLTWRPMGEDGPVAVRLAAMNLSNEDARLHTSFLKDLAPLPGRNIKVSLQGSF